MRIRDILIWLFIFIVGSLIVTAIVNPEYRASVTDTIKDVFSGTDDYSSKDIIEDPLVVSCLSDYEKYARVYKQKYDHARLKIITYQKAYSDEETKEFYDLYGSQLSNYYMLAGISYDWDKSYPVVLISIKVSLSGGSIPLVLFCKPDGKLSDFSRGSIQ